jgi:isopentenyl diphosphate isomerase/L-lactate dehydrogenase-like FMN-dependent dehydrogenase
MARSALGFEWNLRAPERLLSLEDYRRAARRRLPELVWRYVDEGADDLVALHDNRAAFGRWSLVGHVLRGTSERDLATKVAGVSLDLPVLLGPTGFSGLSRWDGDLGAARAAASRGTRYVLSTASSWSIEEVAAASDVGHFFQLYPRAGSMTRVLMERAWGAGMKVLIVTVDTPVKGNREGERRSGMGIPPEMTPRRLLNVARHPRWAFDIVRHRRVSGRNFVDTGGVSAAVEAASIQEREFMQGGLDWDDLGWIRDQWQGPLYVKGIMRPEDAARAVTLGLDGVVVSNHGGRQLATAPASLDVLPAVVEAVGGRAEVLMDGGVRRGSDVVMALALGARAVLIGRPYVYGLVVDGERGAANVIDILRREIDETLALIGVGSVGDVSNAHITRRPPEVKA